MKRQPSAFGRLLSRRRAALGLSLREAADKLGISHVAWSQVERGVRPALAKRHWSTIADVLKCDVRKVAHAAACSVPVKVTPNPDHPLLREIALQLDLRARTHADDDVLRAIMDMLTGGRT